MYDEKLYPFTNRWLSFGEQRVHYIDEGTGPILLFSHAPLGSSFMYRTFIQQLSQYYRCIALDYPGFGISSSHAKDEYTIRSQKEILEQFIDLLQLQDIIGLGHDTGGPSLFKIATEQPDRFKALILTDTIIYPTTEYPRIHRMLGIVGSRVFQAINARTNLLVHLTFNLGVMTRKLSKEEKGQYYQLYETPTKRRRITRMLYSLRAEQSFMEKLAKDFEQKWYDKPVLLMYGDKDPVHQLGIPKRIQEALQNANLHLIEGEGHFPHEGQAEKMSAGIHQWIQQLNLQPKKLQVSR